MLSKQRAPKGNRMHPIDRMVVFLRPLFYVLAVLSLPIFLFSYGWMIKQMVEQWHLAFAIGAAFSHLFIFLGIGSLFDSRHPPK